MFERFTDRARRVLVMAQEEARLLNHNFIGTEHILLGLIHEGEGVAAKALESLGIGLEAVRAKVEETIGPAGSFTTNSPPFTPRAKMVLELSLREAMQLGHHYIGTEHILLGLVREGEGVAAQVLVGMGAGLPRVREEVLNLLGTSPEPEEAGERVQGASRRRVVVARERCRLCGRDLWEVDRFITAGDVRVCGECVTTAAEVLRAAQIEGRGPEVRLPARVFGEAPDDRALDEIVVAFERVFSGSAGDAERARYLEDAEGLQVYEAEVVARHGRRLTGCRVERIRFIGADRARVRFTLTIIRGGSIQIDGTAVRLDGRWKVSRDTQTDLLRRIGVHVPPPEQGPP